ncbi:MAG: PQQ-binding-like beta-propeller repeat protein [Candidatus Eremiobacterota bacterium]
MNTVSILLKYSLIFLLLIILCGLSSASTITPLWEYKAGGQIFSSPVCADINDDGKIEIIFGSNDSYVHVVDGETGKTVWDYKTGDKIISSPSVADINGDGRLEVIVTSQDHFAYALRGNRGELLWKFDGKDWLNSSPSTGNISGNGDLAVSFGNQKGTVYLVDGKTGKEIWEFTTGGDVSNAPSMADIDGDGILEVLVGSADKKIYCLKGNSGKEMWNFPGTDVFVSSVVTGDINGDGAYEVIACSYDKNIYALNGKSGQILWKYTAGDSIDCTPSLGDVNSDGKIDIAVGSYDNCLYIINGSNGELIWKQITGNWISSSPVIADTEGSITVAVASWDEYLYMYNGKDGMLKDKYKLSGRLLSSPALFNRGGNLFAVIASEQGKVSLLNISSACKEIIWGKFHGDSWNTGCYKNAVSYGKALLSGNSSLWGPEGYTIAKIKKVTFTCTCEVNDKQIGNGNGTLQPGETAVLNILLSNITQEEGTGIKLKISSKNSDVNVTPAVIDIGSISASETRQFEVAMKAGDHIPTGSADININIEGKNCEKFSDNYQIAVIGESPPELALKTRIDDDLSGASSGNGDGKINQEEIVELWVTVNNNGKGTARDTLLKLSTSTQGVKLLQDQFLLGNIPPGQEAPGKLVFQVPAGVKAGNVDLNISVSDKGGYSKELRETVAVVSLPPVVVPTQIAVSSPTPAPELPPVLSYAYRINDDNTGSSSGNGDGVINAGETVELFVTVKNTGKGIARGVTVAIKPEEQKIQMGQGKFIIGNIPPGSEGEGKLVFTVPSDMASGNVKFSLDLYEEKGFGKSGQEMAMQVVSLPSLSYSYKILKAGENRQINPGSVVTMKMTVRNSGPGAAQGAKVNISCNNPLIKIDTPLLDLGNIPAGAEMDKDISFSVDKTAKEEDLQFKLTLTDGQGYKKDGDMALAVVLPYVEEVKPAKLSYTCQFDDDSLGSSSGNSDGIINPGETVELWVTVKNTGEGTAKHVVLSLESQNSNIVLNQSKTDLGSIPPGSEAKGKLLFSAKDASQKDIKFKLDVQESQGFGIQGQIAAELKQLEAPITIALKKPVDLTSGKPVEVSDSKMTVEGIVNAGNGIGSFEIASYVGKMEDGKNPDWTEKGPRAVAKKEYFFTQDVSLKPGLNYISIRAVDATGKEVVQQISVMYKPKEGQVWAVVIGIGKYESQKVTPLNYSASDAQAVYDYLTTKGGFSKDHVQLLLNEQANLKAVKTALGTFLREKAMKDDLVFIYYSGHGAPEIDNNSNDGDGLSKYIVTYDADPDNLYATALPMDEISNIFTRLSSQRVVFFVDSCYSGASGGKTFAGQEGGKAGNISDNFLKRLSSGTGRIVITASDANEVALESKKLGHGIFTYYLLQGLSGKADKDKNGFVTADEVYNYLHQEVAKESDNRQHPLKMSKGQVEGEIILGTGE